MRFGEWIHLRRATIICRQGTQKNAKNQARQAGKNEKQGFDRVAAAEHPERRSIAKHDAENQGKMKLPNAQLAFAEREKIVDFSLLMPGALWWSAIKATPSIYTKEAATTSRGVGIRQAVVTVILLVAFSIFVQWGHGKIISWIADRNPDAAYRAGVTGSRPSSWFQNGK